jgi:hypothetical protein
MLFPENFLNFREKFYICGKMFWYILKMFSIFREKSDISGKFFGMSRTLFEMISPPFLLEKCPSKPGPSNF